MRRVLLILALLAVTTPTSWASGRSRTALTTHTHLQPSTSLPRTHAPGVFPRQEAAELKESVEVHAQALRQSTLGTFLIHTLLGLSATSSH